MIQSHVIEIGGTFVGAAIAASTGFRFRAVHAKVEELDESTWLSLDELKRAVRHLFTTGRLGAGPPSAAFGLPEADAGALLHAPAMETGSWME